MRTAIALLFSLLLAGAAAAQQDLKSYAPEPRLNAPVLMNAEVVRVNPDHTAVFRSESGEITLTAEGVSAGMLGSLHAGDKVLVEYREARTADGRLTRYVTSVRPASALSGEPGGARVVPARLTAGSTVRARILSYDKRRRRVTVVDESGSLRSLPLRSGLTGLDVLVPGANVGLTLGAVRGGVVSVTGIASLGSTPVFASGNAFPTISGQFVGFDRSTGLVTLDTATADRVTFPVATSAAGGFTALTRGDTLSVAFDVTSGQPGFRPVAVITGFQPVAAGVVPAAVPAGMVSGQELAVAPASDTGTTGTVAVVPGTAARDRSPFVSTVPSIPAAPPAPGVVLPPAGAKEPMSADDVGQMRAQGERDLAASAVALASTAAAIDPVWAGFKNQCLSGVTAPAVTAGREWYLLAEDRIPTPPDDACRAMHSDLTGRARAFLSQLETVEDAARKADVLPARVREVLDRHKL